MDVIRKKAKVVVAGSRVLPFHSRHQNKFSKFSAQGSSLEQHKLNKSQPNSKIKKLWSKAGWVQTIPSTQTTHWKCSAGAEEKTQTGKYDAILFLGIKLSM